MTFLAFWLSLFSPAQLSAMPEPAPGGDPWEDLSRAVHGISDAEALAHELKWLAGNTAESGEVSFHHLEGVRPDPEVFRLAELLSNEDFSIKAYTEMETEFATTIANLSESLSGTDRQKAKLLTFPDRRSSLATSLSNPRQIVERLTEFKRRLFGTPREPLVECWVHTDAEGKMHLRFQPEARLAKMGGELSLGAVGSLSLALLIKGHPFDARFIVSNLVLAALTFSLTMAMREITFSRLSHAQAFYDETLPQGEKIFLGSNDLFFVTWSFLQELFVNACVLASLLPLPQLGEALFINAPLNAALSVYSSFVVEKWKSLMVRERDTAVREHRDEESAKYGRKVAWLVFIWGNILFPIIRMIHLNLEQRHDNLSSWLAALPFIIVGTGTLIFEKRITGNNDTVLRRMQAWIRNRFLRSPSPNGCSTAVVLSSSQIVAHRQDRGNRQDE